MPTYYIQNRRTRYFVRLDGSSAYRLVTHAFYATGFPTEAQAREAFDTLNLRSRAFAIVPWSDLTDEEKFPSDPHPIDPE